MLYYPIIAGLVGAWSTNGNYSHGYLIPFISGYMVWTVIKDGKLSEPVSDNAGLFVLILGLCQFLAARVGSEYFLQRASMITVLLGLLWYLAGRKLTKNLTYPVLYLLFMIPFPAIVWDRIAFPMKLLASYLAVRTIGLMGISVLREGNIIYLPNTTLEVADACSGLRSLMSLLALSAAFVFFSHNTKPRKLLLLFSAVPIAILTNIIRLTLTAALAGKYGEEIAQGFMHQFSGWLVFLLGLAMLFGMNGILSRSKGS